MTCDGSLAVLCSSRTRLVPHLGRMGSLVGLYGSSNQEPRFEVHARADVFSDTINGGLRLTLTSEGMFIKTRWSTGERSVKSFFRRCTIKIKLKRWLTQIKYGRQNTATGSAKQEENLNKRKRRDRFTMLHLSASSAAERGR